MVINCIKSGDLFKHLPEFIDLFITTVSYEDRCLKVPNNISHRCGNAVIFKFNEFESATQNNLSSLEKYFKHKEIREISYSNPVGTADAIKTILTDQFNDDGKFVIDISTFNRETLLMILKLISSTIRTEALQNIYFVYNAAAEMNTEWLTRGVKNHRTVLGYSGSMMPTHHTHLMVMVGFERDRVQYLIDVYEPHSVSIGFGRVGESIAEKFQQKNAEVVDHIVNLYGDDFIDTFDYSLIDPCNTIIDLSKQIDNYNSFNTVLSPLNNKLSSLAAGVVGILRPEIQICYTEMEVYNTANYSEPSDVFYVCRADNLLVPL